MSDIDHEALEGALSRIRNDGFLPVEAWPDAGLAFADVGLVLQQEDLSWPSQPDYLSAHTIQQAFADVEVLVFDCIDSTNTHLMARKDSAANTLCTAELQVGGRGRRGRSWLSPYARNLSMSMGFASTRGLAELGGLSSVVGLALVAGLEDVGVESVKLKWPNDVLVHNQKLCGILVELLTRPTSIEFVVGIGVNVDLSEAEMQGIGQPVTDLRRLGVTADRTSLLVSLLTRVREFLRHFEEHGFQPFVSAFNSAHLYHEKQCDILQGDQRMNGFVVGIGAQGQLCLRTKDGEQQFHGGEVSLRPASSS